MILTFHISLYSIACGHTRLCLPQNVGKRNKGRPRYRGDSTSRNNYFLPGAHFWVRQDEDPTLISDDKMVYSSFADNLDPRFLDPKFVLAVAPFNPCFLKVYAIAKTYQFPSFQVLSRKLQVLALPMHPIAARGQPWRFPPPHAVITAYNSVQKIPAAPPASSSGPPMELLSSSATTT